MDLEAPNLAARTATVAGCDIRPSPSDFNLRPDAARRDAITQAQHLHPNSVVDGVLNQLQSGSDVANSKFSAALCPAGYGVKA